MKATTGRLLLGLAGTLPVALAAPTVGAGQHVVEVKVDRSGKGVFLNPLPYDEAFLLKGSAAGYTDIALTISPTTGGYWSYDQNPRTDAWKKSPNSSDDFTFRVEPLSVGVEYSFKLTFSSLAVPNNYNATATATPSAELNKEHSPYTLPDLGVGFASGFSRPFFFVGAAWHFGAPVDSSVGASKYWSDCKWRCVRKFVGVHLGMALTAPADARDAQRPYEKMWTAGSPMIGLNLRVSRTVRINGGVLFYRVPDANPLLPSTSRESFYLSLSTDYGLSSAVSAVRAALIGG